MIKRKKLSIVLVFLICIGMISGCGTSDESKKLTKDEKAFIEAVQKGLQDRWEIQNEEEENGDDVEKQKELRQRCVNTELGTVDQYSALEFSDEEFKKAAAAYIVALKSQNEALKGMYSGDEKADENWKAASKKRAVSLIKFVDYYDLKVDKKYDKNIEKIRKEAK